MPEYRNMILLIAAAALALALAAPAFADDGPLEEIPVAPELVIPPPSPTTILVAQDPGRFDELKADGYRVYPDIGQAIARADDGDSIYVTAGIYEEYMYIEDRHGLSLIGEEGVLVVADNDNDVCFLIECSEIIIHNIDMVHKVGESPCLHNCVVIWDCQDVLIEYCDISGCGYIGVEVLGNGAPDNIHVLNCAIHDCEEAFYDVPGNTIIMEGNVLWNNSIEYWDPTGWNEGEMFGSERQPHDYMDYTEWTVPDDVPKPPAFELPPADTPGLRVVAGDALTADLYEVDGYEVYYNIQDAVDASADSDMVYVSQGVYFENIELTDLKDFTLVGEELTLLVSDLFSDVVSVNNCDNLRIYNIDVVHEWGDDCSQNCYVILDSEDVLLEYCDISGCGFIGIWAWGFDEPCSVKAQYCYIHDCEAAYCAESGAAVRLFGTVIRDCVSQTW